MLPKDVHLQRVPGGAHLVAILAGHPAVLHVLALNVVDHALLVLGRVRALKAPPVADGPLPDHLARDQVVKRWKTVWKSRQLSKLGRQWQGTAGQLRYGQSFSTPLSTERDGLRTLLDCQYK